MVYLSTMPTFVRLDDTDFACPMSSKPYIETKMSEQDSFTLASFTTTSFSAGTDTAVPLVDLYGNVQSFVLPHILKLIVYTGAGQPADELGNTLDTYICIRCSWRGSFYRTASRTALGL